MSKPYKDIRPTFVFDTSAKQVESKIEERPITQSSPQKLIKIDDQEQQQKQIQVQKNQQSVFDEEQLRKFEQMYQMCQQLNSEKAQLLDKIDQLQQDLQSMERQLEESEKIQSEYEKNEQKFKEEQTQYLQDIETLQCQLEVAMNQSQNICKINNNNEQIYEILMKFVYQENLSDLINEIDKSNQNMIVQFVVEYLINQYTQKKNQEEKYENHIKDNIQIIYDLQNKIQDLTNNGLKITTPKSIFSETMRQSKMSNSASNFHKVSSNTNLDREELLQKIAQLKKQGKQINKKWQEFCENMLKERNDVIKYYKRHIDYITDQNAELRKTISEMIQYLGQDQQELWLQMIDLKQKIQYRVLDLSESDNLNKSLIEQELKQLYSIQAQLRSQMNRNRPCRQDLF